MDSVLYACDNLHDEKMPLERRNIFKILTIRKKIALVTKNFMTYWKLSGQFAILVTSLKNKTGYSHCHLLRGSMTLMCRGKEGRALLKQCGLMGRAGNWTKRDSFHRTHPDFCDFNICEHMVTARRRVAPGHMWAWGQNQPRIPPLWLLLLPPPTECSCSASLVPSQIYKSPRRKDKTSPFLQLTPYRAV